MVTRRLSHLLLILLLPAVFGSLAEGWLHAASHGHAEAHAPAAVADAHGECDAWQAERDGHETHQGLQFEPVSALHHGDHAAVCPACGHTLSVAASTVETLRGVAPRIPTSPWQESTAVRTRRGPASPRAPPLA